MRKIASNDDLMTTREAGELLGVAVRTVQLWVESGVLPAWRTAGGHRRIARSAVAKLMAERSEILAPAQDAPVAPLKLLVVEDDPIMLRLYTQMIQRWKFPVELTTANNGFEGLLRMGQIHPDVLVTDLSMPGMDGFEMLRTLCQPASGLAQTRMVVVSALDDEEIAAQGGLPAGVVFFRKPVDFVKLQKWVRSCAPAVSTRKKA